MDQTLYEKLNKINILNEGLEKSLRAILKVYRDSERGLPPATEDLDEGLYLFAEYLERMVKGYRKDYDAMAYWASSEEAAKESMERYITRDKEVAAALQSSATDRQKLIALDNTIDLVHNDAYMLEHFFWGKESKNKELKRLAGQIIELLRRLGKFEKATDLADPKKWVVGKIGGGDKKSFDTEEEAYTYVKSKGSGYAMMQLPVRGDK